MTNAVADKNAQLQAAAEPNPKWFVLALSLLALALFALRLSAPSNLLDQDQERPGTYVVDVVKNGHWMCQRDLTGDVTSKPPLWTWISALASLAWGKVDRFTLWLPGALGAWGTVLLVFFAGRKTFGVWSGFWSGIAVMVCTAGLKEFGLARTDGVFALTVTACALAAYRAWTVGDAAMDKNWAWLLFWFCAGVTTLTKGPLGVLLGAAGLMAAVWENRGAARQSLRGPHLAGVTIFVAIAGGWFLLAYRDCGQALIDKMIGRELVGHVARADKTNFPGRYFYQPILYYLGRGAPWSIAGLYALWHVCKKPSADIEQRRFERFLFCWFCVGLVIFSVSPHQRGDLLWPIMPAAALLAGRQIEQWTKLIGSRFRYGLATVVSCMLIGFGIYYFRIQPRQAISRQTAQMVSVASQIQVKGGEFPLTYVDAPLGLQVVLNTWHPKVSFDRAAELLRGREQVFLAVKDMRALQQCRNTNDSPFHYLFGTQAVSRTNEIKIISNYPASSPDPELGFALESGPLLFRAQHAALLKAAESKAEFAATGAMAQVRVVNQSNRQTRIEVTILRHTDHKPISGRPQILLPGQIWEIKVP